MHTTGADVPEEYIVSYLDIFGYREAVERGEGEAVDKLLAAVSGMVGDAKGSVDTLLDKTGDDERRDTIVHRTLGYRVFSDNVAVYCGLYPDPQDDRLEHALNGVAIGTVLMIQAMIQSKLLENGFLSRGGAVIGRFRVDEDFIFGKALVDAVLMKEKKAGFPRTLVDPAVKRKLIDSMTASGRCGPDAEKLGDVFLDDSDGGISLHYLCARAHLEKILHGTDVGTNYRAILEGHRRAIEGIIARNGSQICADPGTWGKYAWAVANHNRVVGDGQPELLIDPSELYRRGIGRVRSPGTPRGRISDPFDSLFQIASARDRRRPVPRIFFHVPDGDSLAGRRILRRREYEGLNFRDSQFRWQFLRADHRRPSTSADATDRHIEIEEF